MEKVTLELSKSALDLAKANALIHNISVETLLARSLEPQVLPVKDGRNLIGLFADDADKIDEMVEFIYQVRADPNSARCAPYE